MAAAISSLSISKGSPYGGQLVTITGSGFGSSGSVKFGTLTATPVSWSATSVQVRTPRRVDASGLVVFTGGTVTVTLTAQDASTATASYEYAKTRVAVAVDAIVSRIKGCTVDKGYFFTIGADQVHTMKEDLAGDTAAAWPQVQVYFEGGNIPEEQHDAPFDFSKDTVPFVVQAAMPCQDPQTWYEEAVMLASDIRRALMIARDNDATSDTTAISDWTVGKISDNAGGGLAVATVQGFFIVRAIVNDPTSSTTFDANLP